MGNLSEATNQNFAIHVDSISNLLDNPFNNALSKHLGDPQGDLYAFCVSGRRSLLLLHQQLMCTR